MVRVLAAYGHFRKLIVWCVHITCGVYAGASAVYIYIYRFPDLFFEGCTPGCPPWGFFQVDRIVNDPTFHLNSQGCDTIPIKFLMVYVICFLRIINIITIPASGQLPLELPKKS